MHPLKDKSAMAVWENGLPDLLWEVTKWSILEARSLAEENEPQRMVFSVISPKKCSTCFSQAI